MPSLLPPLSNVWPLFRALVLRCYFPCPPIFPYPLPDPTRWCFTTTLPSINESSALILIFGGSAHGPLPFSRSCPSSCPPIWIQNLRPFASAPFVLRPKTWIQNLDPPSCPFLVIRTLTGLSLSFPLPSERLDINGQVLLLPSYP